MAGFFGFFDYTKPGPGVPKDGPPKARIVVFFEIVQRKFWNLIKINLLFNLFNIPAVILGMFAALFLFPGITPDVTGSSDAVVGEILLKFILLSVLLCIPVVTVGPAQAGFTYLLRNYSREEHAFIWGDFKDNAMKNFKQSVIISVIDFFVAILMIWSIRAYIIIGGGILMTIGTTLMVMMFIIFLIMHMYIYPMLVTFNLSIKQLYKNALIFAVIKLLPNIGILLLCMLILALTFGVIIPFSQLIGLVLYAFLTVSFIGMITNFYVYPKLQKYMMKQDEAETEDDEEYEEEEEEEAETTEEDMAEEDEADGLPAGEEKQGGEDGGEEESSEIKRYF